MNDPLAEYEWNQADLPREIEGALFTVIARDRGGRFQAIGTGFITSSTSDSAIGITAAHVLAEVQRLQRRNSNRSHATLLPEFAPRPAPIDISLSEVLIVSNGGSDIIASRIVGLAFDEARDIGFLKLVPQPIHATRYPLPEFVLDDEMPRIEDRVCVATYANLHCESKHRDEFSLQRKPVLRVGRVTNVFAGGQRLCRGPCFETSIPMFSGMSGGPVFFFAESGVMRAVGVVCSDPDVDSPEKNDRSKCGKSLIARLPVTRLSGTPHEKQEVSLSIFATTIAGEWEGKPIGEALK